VTTRRIFHYTNDVGSKAVSSQRIWVFRASRPPGDHPIGAYFTTLNPDSILLATRLRIPNDKLLFVFCFADNSDLTRLAGGRGEYISFSPTDYYVEELRQLFQGTRQEAMEQLK
jgi:hypothetical protein